MRYTAVLGSILTAVLVVGCDDKKEVPTPPAPAQPSPQAQKSVTDQARNALDQGKQQVAQAAEDVKTGAAQAVTEVKTEGAKLADQAKVQGQQAVDQTKQALSGAQSAISQYTAKPEPSAAAPTAAPATAFDYKAKLTEAATYLKENKVDLADKALIQVEQRKTSIPTEYHARIDSLRKMVDSAKATGNTGISLPKF